MRFLFALLCLVVAAPVLADDAPPDTSTIVADDVVITGSTLAAPPAPGVIVVDDGALVVGTIRELVDIATNAKAVGVVVAVILAIAALLKLLTKHGAFARLLERTGKTWIRPLLAAATGAVTTLAATLSAGIRDPIGIGAAIVSGIIAGLGAAGYVDAARVALFPDARTKESVSGSDLIFVAETLEREVVHAGNKSVEAAIRDVDAVRELPIAKRVEALAGLLRKAKA